LVSSYEFVLQSQQIYSLQVLQSEGLNKYVDAGYLQHELSEATGLSNHELDVAAHQLMSGRQNSTPQQSNAYPNRRDYDGNVI